MTLIEVRLSFEVDAERCKPQARAFIDLAPEGGFGSELELPLRQLGRTVWVGAFVLGEKHPLEFLYRLGLIAHRGAEFWLSFRHRGLGRDLLTDGDTLPAAKCWLVGSCPLPAPARRSIAGKPAASNANVVALDRNRERR
jgi:hypothetical protein